MLKVKTEITDTKSKDYMKLEQFLKGTKSAYVTIGIHQDAGEYPDGPDVVEVALWNEFGTSDVPARSFIRSVVDSSDFNEKVNTWREQAIENVLYKGWSMEKALQSIGEKVKLQIQNKIKSNVPPPYGTGKHGKSADDIQKAQEAKRRRGFPVRTLIETSLLLRSVAYKVVVE